MPATNIKKYKELADILGSLLVKSNLDDETKDLILESADKLPEHAAYKLMRILQGEQKELEAAAFDIGLFLQEQDKNWAKTKEEQQNTANAIANKWLLKLS